MESVENVDANVWNALINGDKVAYATVYKVYFRKFYNYGFKLTNNVGLLEDCIQETLTAFWIERDKHKVLEKPDAYLFVCFRNRLIRGLQCQKNYTALPDNFDFIVEISIDQVMIDAEHLYEQQIDLTTSLSHLTPRQKEAIYLKFYENFSYEHIADMLRISTKATYKLMARAITELRIAYATKRVKHR